MIELLTSVITLFFSWAPRNITLLILIQTTMTRFTTFITTICINYATAEILEKTWDHDFTTRDTTKDYYDVPAMENGFQFIPLHAVYSLTCGRRGGIVLLSYALAVPS